MIRLIGGSRCGELVDDYGDYAQFYERVKINFLYATNEEIKDIKIETYTKKAFGDGLGYIGEFYVFNDLSDEQALEKAREYLK